MPEAGVGDREKIAILLAEYASLRAEANSRISNSYQVFGFESVLIVWLLQQPIGPSFWIGICFMAIGTLYFIRLITFDVMNAASRVRELEVELNKRAGEKLLLWESERDGLNASYWQRLFLPFLNRRRRDKIL